MNPAKKYASAGALRRALEDRLRQMANTEHVDLARLDPGLSAGEAAGAEPSG